MPSTELKSNTEWKKWGKEDPLLAVASWANKQKDGAAPWTDEEFYALGLSDWHDFWRHWQQYGVNTESCLEVGCGAGRITKQLGQTFRQVKAVDVSEDMIRRAEKAVGANVEFTVIDGIHLPQPDSSIKAVFSTHVLQHLDAVEFGYAYFREFYRVLDSDGTLMVHLPLYSIPGGPLESLLVGSVRSTFRKMGDMRAAIKRRAGVKIMRGTRYPMNGLYAFLSGLGFKEIEFRIFPTRSNGDLHPFVFASK